jgi:hypothetical protein
MAADVFSRTVGWGGAFSADGAVISLTGCTGIGLLAQNISWQYMQNIQRLYEIGSTLVYLVAGRTQGQAGIQRVMGPAALTSGFYTQYGNVCNASSNTMTFSATANCGSAGGANTSIGLNCCVIQSYGGSVQAENMIVNEQIQLLYLYLTHS